MKEILYEIYEYYINYCNNSKIFFLYLLCLGILFFMGKDLRRSLAWPSVIIMLVIYNPVFYKLLWCKLLKDVYWRMMWMIPVLPVIAVTFVCIVNRIKNNIAKTMTYIFLMLVVVICGDNIYADSSLFVSADNLYKLPQSTIETVDALLELDETPYCVISNDTYNYSRQYRSEVRQAFGRDKDGYIASSEMKPYVWGIINSTYAMPTNYTMLFELMRYAGYDYFVGESDMLSDDRFVNAHIDSEVKLSGSSIYYNSRLTDRGDSWRITQYGYNNGVRSCYTIENDDYLIVVDGGYDSDRWMLDIVLQQHNYEVDCWIVTRATDEHFCALINRLENNTDELKIHKILSVDVESLMNNLPSGYNAENIQRYRDCIRNMDVSFPKQGEIFQYGNMSVEIVLNNENLIFKLNTDKQTMLFTGDANQKDDEAVKEYLGGCNIDILQIGCHFSGCMTKEVYTDLGAENVLIDTYYGYFAEKDNSEMLMLIDSLSEQSNVFDFDTVPNVLLFR